MTQHIDDIRNHPSMMLSKIKLAKLIDVPAAQVKSWVRFMGLPVHPQDGPRPNSQINLVEFIEWAQQRPGLLDDLGREGMQRIGVAFSKHVMQVNATLERKKTG